MYKKNLKISETFKTNDSSEISFLLFNLNIRSNIYFDILSKSLFWNYVI